MQKKLNQIEHQKKEMESISIKHKINDLKKRLEESVIEKGCVKYYPDELKEEALLLHIESKMSLRIFSPMIGSCPRTMKAWRDYFGMPKPSSKYPNYHRMLEPEKAIVQLKNRSGAKGVEPKQHQNITLSDAETKDSVLAKKRIRNKLRYEKLKLESKISKTQIIVTKPKEEVSDDIKAYLSRSIDKAIPIVCTRGDVIPQKFRDMQEEWLSKHKPKRYSNGVLIDDSSMQ